MLKLIKPLHALPGFPGFVTNTTVSLSHTNTGRRLVKRESKGGGTRTERQAVNDVELQREVLYIHT